MRPRALVVDDSLTVRMDLRSALSNAGFLVVACSTKELAWTTLKNGSFSLAVLDINLPDGNGIDLLKQIRSDPEVRKIKVILLTTEAEVQTRIHGLASGADRYIGKPYERGLLARAARELCEMTEHPAGPSSRRGLTGRKILVVDDSPTFGLAVAQLLRQDGYEVVLAGDGEGALALLAVEPFACVLLDLMLPGLDGLATCRQIRQLPGGQEVVVLAVTASEDPGVRHEVLLAGGDDLALKTSTLELLRVHVRSLLLTKRHGHEPAKPSHQAAS